QDEGNDNTDYTGNGSNSTGILGTNTPATGTGTTTNFKSRKNQKTYIVDRETSHTSTPQFRVNNLSVSVVLDQKKVSAADLTKWNSQIAAAAGINTVRGDQLQVQTMSMDKNVQALAQSAFKARTTPVAPASPIDLMAAIRYAITLLIVGMALFLAWRSVK